MAWLLSFLRFKSLNKWSEATCTKNVWILWVCARWENIVCTNKSRSMSTGNECFWMDPHTFSLYSQHGIKGTGEKHWVLPWSASTHANRCEYVLQVSFSCELHILSLEVIEVCQENESEGSPSLHMFIGININSEGLVGCSEILVYPAITQTNHMLWNKSIRGD